MKDGEMKTERRDEGRMTRGGKRKARNKYREEEERENEGEKKKNE